jgi:MFS transporter, DHA1 family, inner membrane transport protein
MMSYASQVSRKPAGSRTAALLMFALLLASYSLNAMDRQIFPLVAADVRGEFGFNLAHVGLLSTIFTLGMAIAGIPIGLLLARMSRKAALLIGLAIFSIGTVLMTTAHSFAGMLLCRATTGIGEAMQLTVILAIGTSYFRRFRSTAVGSTTSHLASERSPVRQAAEPSLPCAIHGDCQWFYSVFWASWQSR